jgi:hypothetical protein
VNRRELERNARREMGLVSDRHLAELERLLGSPPDPSNVPQAFWERVEREHQRTLSSILLLAFMGGSDDEDAGGIAGTWSDWQAASTSARYVATSQARLERLATGWDDPLPGELRNGLSGIFGPDRDATVVGTEVTRGLGAGTVAAAKASDAYQEGRVRLIWRLGQREQHCPVCRRLNGTDETVWGLEVEAPPIHPNCGCWIDVVTVPARELTGARG